MIVSESSIRAEEGVAGQNRFDIHIRRPLEIISAQLYLRAFNTSTFFLMICYCLLSLSGVDVNKKLRVCDVCGSFLSIMDSDKYVTP